MSYNEYYSPRERIAPQGAGNGNIRQFIVDAVTLVGVVVVAGVALLFVGAFL